jgi:Tetratricopeptide repeat
VSDSPGKFLNFLDQLLPFLAACPSWLRLWVHALILLNFLTIAALAVAYLYSKEKATDEGSLSNFSIATPTENQQIPLEGQGIWMLAGSLPKSKTADFSIQVLKLPDAESIPQTGQKIKSSFDGNWSFEPARFAGSGLYEIKATGLLNGDSLVRTVHVKCEDKPTAFKLSIEREKQFRQGANILSLPPDPTLPVQKISDLQDLQNQFIAQFPPDRPPTQDELQKAFSITNQGLDLVDSILPLAPDNLDLQNFRAFFLKNYAMVAQDLHRPEASQALEEARLMFEAVINQAPRDTNAWNGLGNVYMMYGQPSKALFYVKRAVELAPDNPFAQHDLVIVTKAVQDQEAAKSK